MVVYNTGTQFIKNSTYTTDNIVFSTSVAFFFFLLANNHDVIKIQMLDPDHDMILFGSIGDENAV